MARLLLPILLTVAMAAGCRDQTPKEHQRAAALASGGDEEEVARYDFEQVHVYRADDPAHPLFIRRHLPLPERLTGLKFISVEPRTPAWKPGLSARGYYFLTFDWSQLEWEHEDYQDRFPLVGREDGTIEAGSPEAKIHGRFDPSRLQVQWDGTWYEVMKPLYGPEPSPKAHSPPAIVPFFNGFEIKLTSTVREVKAMNYPTGFGDGHIWVETLGHSEGYSVFDYGSELEGGYSVRRHRLPISQQRANVQVGANRYAPDRPLTASFDITQSKLVRFGNSWSEVSQARYACPRKVNGTVYCVYTLNVREGSGPICKSGATVTIWPVFYADPQYTKLRQGAKHRRSITFSTRVGKVDSALDPAVEEMKVGGWRRVSLREECAGILHDVVPNLASGEFIYMEFQLLTVQAERQAGVNRRSP